MTSKTPSAEPTPKKDVIYIDVDDDITAIIGKVKESHGSVVALVPPKRIGVLQSAVNLRLLCRAAKASKKHLVLITTNQALVGIAATAKLPVAKSLQSKPEIAEVPALLVDDGEDVIDGSELSIGEHAGIHNAVDEVTQEENASSDVEKPASSRRKLMTRQPKIPDFGTFRKRLVLGVAGLIGLVGFLVWATWFAPRATVILSTKTATVDIHGAVKLSDSEETSADKGIIRAIQQTITRKETVSFQASGTGNKGEKATGTVKLSAQSPGGIAVLAGTKLTSSTGLVFVTNSTAAIPASSFGSPGCFPTACPGTTTVGVTALEGGTKYNAATGSLSGASGGASASFTGPSSGGTDKIVKIVTQDDIDRAKEDLNTKVKAIDTSGIQAEMNFADDVVVIGDSLANDADSPVAAPGVNEEAANGGTLTLSITYHMYGVARSELEKYLDAAVKERIADEPDQRVYDNGSAKATLVDFTLDEYPQATVSAKGKTGLDISESRVKELVKGKRYGDVQAELEAISGVEQADTKFWPFWVNHVPNDITRIKIEFRLNDA